MAGYPLAGGVPTDATLQGYLGNLVVLSASELEAGYCLLDGYLLAGTVKEALVCGVLALVVPCGGVCLLSTKPTDWRYWGHDGDFVAYGVLMPAGFAG